MVIADSSALFSLLVETDVNYHRAIKSSKQLLRKKTSIIIPNDVFSELINILGKKFDHKIAVLAAEYLLNSELFLIENITIKIRKSALEIFERQKKSVSYTDCIVMAFADHFHTKEIFGFDEAFKENGYTIL